MKIVSVQLIIKLEDDQDPTHWDFAALLDLNSNTDEILDKTVKELYSSPKEEE